MIYKVSHYCMMGVSTCVWAF